MLCYIAESDPDNLFKMNNITGSITLNRNLTRDSYPIIVTVSNMMNQSSRQNAWTACVTYHFYSRNQLKVAFAGMRQIDPSFRRAHYVFSI